MAQFSSIGRDARRRLAIGEMDLSSHQLKLALMKDDFVFSFTTQFLMGHVEAHEHPTINGYVAGGELMDVTAITADPTTGITTIAWNPVSWSANGGSIGPVGSAIIYNNSIGDRPILGYLDFNQSLTQSDGGLLLVIGTSVIIQ